MTEPDARPQDAVRSHRRKGAPSPATASLLAEYQDAMRLELRAVLIELQGSEPPAGLGMVPAVRVRPSLTDRSRLWDLGIKLGRELAGEIDPRPAAPDGPASTRARAKRPDFG